MNCRLLIITLLVICFEGAAVAQDLTIVLSGIRSGDGVIRLAFFDSQEAWEQERPVIERIVHKTGMVGGVQKLTLHDIPAGHYGIAVLDDENGNGRMDYKLMLPREGCGFSNYVHSSVRKPRFSDFDFEFRASLNVKVTMTYFL